MRIIAGTHRGRRIPFNNKRFGNARVTSDFVKEAVFGSLGVDLAGRRFLDLFSGSGQMGLEAVSRGATAWMNDTDRKRSGFTRSVVEEWGLDQDVVLTTEDWHKLIDRMADENERFDIIYVDPPYDAVTRSGTSVSEACLDALSVSSILNGDGSVFVQHDRRTDLPEAAGSLSCFRSKRYGDSLLSTYRHR